MCQLYICKKKKKKDEYIQSLPLLSLQSVRDVDTLIINDKEL